ncbi:MAG: cation transporter [Campylobacterales bacterium]|nr:cation transporter [Campylobacterales bacterium]
MGHDHTHETSGKNLFITIILNAVITLAQIIGGVLSGSLALLSDAMHNFSDVLALVLAWWSHQIANKPRDEYKTFGYKRAEILAALFNASVLIGIGILLIIEAIDRFIHPQALNSTLVIVLGGLGVVINTLSVFIIKEDSHDNMNIKAAYLHLLGDVMTSVGVVVGGILMYYFGVFWIDSLVSILIAGYLIVSSLPLVKDSISILMQTVPEGIDIQKIKQDVEAFEGIGNIHHLHIWNLGEHDIFLEAHIDFEKDLSISQSNKILNAIKDKLKSDYHILHITFQIEYNNCDNTDLILKEDCHV